MRVYSDPPEPFPHNEEPQLRKLGLTTHMNKGVPTLAAPHKICDIGKILTAEQAQLLKLIGERMVVFRVGLLCYWDSATAEVTQIEDGGIHSHGGENEKDSEAGSEDAGAMSE